jgi:ATP-dependent Clp protease ATP-binding subunit ClpC
MQDQILGIVDLMIARIESQLRNKDMGLELTDNAKKFLAKKGFDPVLGARPLRRTIQRELEDTLSEQILFNELRPGQIVVVDCEGDPENIEKSKLTFTGADRGATVPDAVPADLGAAATEE